MIITKENGSTRYNNFIFEADITLDAQTIERELQELVSDSTGPIREMCIHVLEAGGKRIRPLLVLYSGLVSMNDSEVKLKSIGTQCTRNLALCESSNLIKAATAAELIHMASLIHDDVIDHSDMRRRRPSVNRIWGNQHAVLCGDYLFAKAFGLMAENRLIKSMDYMVCAIQNMCQAEILQAENLFNLEADIDNYYQRISGKTAIFLECCCKSGAAAAGAGPEQLEALGSYGLNLGFAFQIIDDILDFTGSPEIMGKPQGTDLCQGNITLPVIYLLNNVMYKQTVANIIHDRDFQAVSMDYIKNALIKSGALDKAYERARNHIEASKFALRLLPESEYRDTLEGLTEILGKRIN